jgi:hypothetical protein
MEENREIRKPSPRHLPKDESISKFRKREELIKKTHLWMPHDESFVYGSERPPFFSADVTIQAILPPTLDVAISLIHQPVLEPVEHSAFLLALLAFPLGPSEVELLIFVGVAEDVRVAHVDIRLPELEAPREVGECTLVEVCQAQKTISARRSREAGAKNGLIASIDSSTRVELLSLDGLVDCRDVLEPSRKRRRISCEFVLDGKVLGRDELGMRDCRANRRCEREERAEVVEPGHVDLDEGTRRRKARW